VGEERRVQFDIGKLETNGSFGGPRSRWEHIANINQISKK
jgi:hypothetical protein